jgi:tetraacyldisaccharide 4'-kinase
MKLHPTISAALTPLSWIYADIVRRRAKLFRDEPHRSRRLDAIVLSVGNITVGGTGKTPMVLWLAERLAHMNVPVGILSRGYKGGVRVDRNTQDDVEAQSPGVHFAWSDEVALLSRRLGFKARFGVGPERWAEGRMLTSLGIQWIILDDGFQHMQLHRDADIVLIDAMDPFGSNRLLPAGRLREPLEALGRADVLVITRTDSAPELAARLRKYSTAPIFYAKSELEEIRPLENSNVTCGKAEWLGKRVFAFCGIGNPNAFFRDVEHWGMQLVGRRAFRDHHRFTQVNARRIERAALAAGAEALICTEKDSHNLGKLRFDRLPIFSCDVSVRVPEGDAFWQAIRDAIERNRDKEPQ